MENQLFNQKFKVAFGLIVLAEILSWLFLSHSALNGFTALLIGAGAFILSCKKISYGFYLLLIELLIGSKGYLFFLNLGDFKISLRIILFVAVLTAWLFQMIKNKSSIFSQDINPLEKVLDKNYLTIDKKITVSFLLLCLLVLIGGLSGFLHNQFHDWFFDLNGWLYLLLWPVFFQALAEKNAWQNTLNFFFAGILYLSLKSLLIFWAFSWQLADLSSYAYFWIRNTGVGEITLVINNFYRIFFQSHVFIAIGLIISLIYLMFRRNTPLEKKWLSLTAIASSLSILISLSRSFWVGLFGALLALIFWLLISRRLNFAVLGKFAAIALITLVLEIGFLCLTSNTLKPQIFWGRLGGSNAEAAGSSRLNQLKPLIKEIKKDWLLGSGFGSTATYISNDPRIRQEFPDGKYTTYAFEWGYLDIWLKIGALGILAYLWLIIIVAEALLKQGITGLALFLGLIFLSLTNIFSPYLNHPLGIGYLLLCLAAVNLLKPNHGVEKA